MGCSSENKGYLLIIDNFRLQNSELSKDMKNIMKTFTDLGFYISYNGNRNSKQISDIFNNISSDQTLNYPCFVCIILAYTIDDELLALMGDNDSEIEIEDLTNYFNKKEFEDKKKLFFFQTFVENEKMSPDSYEQYDSAIPEQDLKIFKSIKIKRNFLFSFSRVFGNVVKIGEIYRSGTCFFQTLCECLDINTNEQLDICSIMTKVNNEVFSNVGDTNKNKKSREMSCFLSILNGQLILTRRTDDLPLSLLSE